jgi:hypothetical protein
VTDGNKKFKNQDLPQEIDRHVWRRTFVPTFMMNIARQDNPFEHNVKVSCEAMQKIWDTLFDETPYTVAHSSPVYQLVRINFQFIISLRRHLFRPCNVFRTRGAAPWARQRLQLSLPSVMETLT